MTVGTRELKNRLSYYLRRIREGGGPILVTDRGEIVAELKPITKPRKRSERATLLALAARGDVSNGRGRFSDFKPIRPRRKLALSKIVLDQR